MHECTGIDQFHEIDTPWSSRCFRRPGHWARPTCRAAVPGYQLLREIPVPGNEGWDYLSIDAATWRPYLTHGSKIVVMNLDAETSVGEIGDTPGIHGFAIAPELGRGFSSNGKEAKASIVNLNSLATLSKVDTGENPDAIAYVPSHQEV